MTVQISLGNMPFNNGSIVDDHSVYLEDNRFFRVQSQSNNTFTAAAIYNCSDVWNSGTVGIEHAEHILENFAATGIKVAKISENRFILFYHLGTDLKYRYIDYNSSAEFNKFTVSDEYSIGINLSGHNLYIQLDIDSQKLFLLQCNNGGVSVYRYINLVDNTVNTISVGASFTNVRDNGYIDIWDEDGRIILRPSPNSISHDTSHADIFINPTDDSWIRCNRSTSYRNTLVYHKLDDNRYLNLATFGLSSGSLYYKITPEIEYNNIAVNYNKVIPDTTQKCYYTTGSTYAGFFHSFMMDRFHMMYIYVNNTNEVRARILKIVDHNIGYISDASRVGDGILVTTMNRAGFTRYSLGRFIYRVSNTRFWMPVALHTWRFCEINVSN